MTLIVWKFTLVGELWESLSSCCPPLLALTALGSILLSGKDSKYTIMIVFMHWHFRKTIVLKLNLVTAQTTVESEQAMASKGKTKVHAHHFIVLWYIMLPICQPQSRLTLSASWWMFRVSWCTKRQSSSCTAAIWNPWSIILKRTFPYQWIALTTSCAVAHHLLLSVLNLCMCILKVFEHLKKIITSWLLTQPLLE